jgi:hypothetical protein
LHNLLQFFAGFGGIFFGMVIMEKVSHPGEYGELPPFEQNAARVEEIIANDTESIERALGETTQNVSHPETEANRLAVLASRVSSIVREYGILAAPDIEFVIDMMLVLKESDRSGTGPEPELNRQMSLAVQNLEVRNAAQNLPDQI